MINLFKKRKRHTKRTRSLIDIESDACKKQAREATNKLLELFDKKQSQTAISQ